MKTLKGLALAVLTGIILGTTLNFIWWLEDANPAAWGMVIGVFSTLAIGFVIKTGKGMR
jgi:glucose-6-phosphate dehydrogenase assembly protein OpcA